jgi:hypothetical protein
VSHPVGLDEAEVLELEHLLAQEPGAPTTSLWVVDGAVVVELPVRPPVDRGGQLGVVDHDLHRTGAAAGGRLVTVPLTR